MRSSPPYMAISSPAAVTLLLLLLSSANNVVVFAGPSKPQLTVNLNSELLDKGVINAIEPVVSWKTSGAIPGLADVEGGLTMKIKDDGGMPTSVWGRIKKSAFGSKFSCQVDSTSPKFEDWGIDFQASRQSTSLQVTGGATILDDRKGKSAVAEVHSVKFSQSLVGPIFGGRWTVTPRYNVAKKEGAISTSYGLANTYVTVDATRDKQKVSVSQVLEGGNGVLKPSIDTNGVVDIQYTRPIGYSGGTLTANYKHQNSVGLKYEHGPWVASVAAPAVEELASAGPEDFKFNIRRVIY